MNPTTSQFLNYGHVQLDQGEVSLNSQFVFHKGVLAGEYYVCLEV